MDENTFKIKPYLNALNKLNPQTELGRDVKNIMLHSLDTLAVTEKDTLNEISLLKQEIDEHMKDELLNFIPLSRYTKAVESLFNIKLKEINQWSEQLVALLTDYENLSEKKIQRVETYVPLTKPREEIDIFKESMKPMLNDLFSEIKNKGPLISNSAKKAFIGKFAKTQVDEIILKEMMNDYEANETKDTVKAKTKPMP